METFLREKCGREWSTVRRKAGRENGGTVTRSRGLFPVENDQTEVAAPRSFGRFGQRWLQTIHVVTTIAIVAEQQLFLNARKLDITIET